MNEYIHHVACCLSNHQMKFHHHQQQQYNMGPMTQSMLFTSYSTLLSYTVCRHSNL